MKSHCLKGLAWDFGMREIELITHRLVSLGPTTGSCQHQYTGIRTKKGLEVT